MFCEVEIQEARDGKYSECHKVWTNGGKSVSGQIKVKLLQTVVECNCVALLKYKFSVLYIHLICEHKLNPFYVLHSAADSRILLVFLYSFYCGVAVFYS